MHALDLALFGGFILLTVSTLAFRRFHQYESHVRPEELGPTAWGIYSSQDEKFVPMPMNRSHYPSS